MNSSVKKYKNAVIVVDMIKEFINDNPTRYKYLIPKIRTFLQNAKRNSFFIVYANCTHFSKNEPCVKKWGMHALYNSEESEPVDELKGLEDIIIRKHNYNAFWKTDLSYILHSLQIKYVYIVGIQAIYCIRATAEGAYYEGFKPIIVLDLIEDESDENIQLAKKLYKKMKFTIKNSTEIFK